MFDPAAARMAIATVYSNSTVSCDQNRLAVAISSAIWPAAVRHTAWCHGVLSTPAEVTTEVQPLLVFRPAVEQ